MFHYDDDTDTFTIETQQEVEDTVIQNHEAFKEHTSLDRFGDFMTKIASVPMSIFYDLKKRGILGDNKAMKAWLNDPDNQYFRTRPGRI